MLGDLTLGYVGRAEHKVADCSRIRHEKVEPKPWHDVAM